MRRNVEFESGGLTCRGWLYAPDDSGDEGAPTIVMAHGFSAVKEMYLTRFAEHFASAGFTVLLFDYRYFGDSDGEPRGRLFPWEQIEDYQNAITFARRQPEVDGERIGIWGTSYSGGHVLVVGALDRRVRCVVAQVPLIDGWKNLHRIVVDEDVAALLKALEQDRERRFTSGEINYVPVVAEDRNCALPTADSYEWFTRTHEEMAPNWENRVTLESIEQFIAYSPEAYIRRISPTPLLIAVAENDILTPTDLAIEAYEVALEPKKLVILPGGHFDAYTTGFDESAGAALDWFQRHLS
ncbi:alpha/beta hydrolase [Rubrobacter naiadicus]|uniref:alpha/beta hydrolase n=1 Tax=Rubrobacter naiadicus TaxID=1392641 RepID=UPI00235FA61E|nr:alpha/beta hydrolase [Rubrobacter naiadicus]